MLNLPMHSGVTWAQRGVIGLTRPSWQVLDSTDYRVCADRRFAFVHIPKTAGKSMRLALYGKTGGACHASLPLLLEQLPGRRSEYFVMAFVRSPWDRLYSSYRYLARGGNGKRGDRAMGRELARYGGFGGFVRDWLDEGRLTAYPHFIPQRRFLGRGPDFGVDFLGRFEQLDEDFASIAPRLGVRGGLTTQNASPSADYRAAYDDETRAKVARLYHEDVRAFGYTFDAQDVENLAA